MGNYKYNKKYRERLRVERSRVFGDVCKFCDHMKYLRLHKKDGKPHPRDERTIVMALKNPEEWVRLCGKCHTGVHFCMEILGMSWEEIETSCNSMIPHQ